jgi:hypothetical protein
MNATKDIIIRVTKRLLYVVAFPALIVVASFIIGLYPIIGYIVGRGFSKSVHVVTEVVVDTFSGHYSILKGIKKLLKGDLYG